MGVLKAGLIGEHISRTRLPIALDIMCKLHGLTLEFELIDTAHLPDFEFVATVDRLHAKGWNGVTVTHPFKTDAAHYAGDGMLSELKQLGASNTLVFGDKITGHNTDYTGFRAAFEAFGNDKIGDVVMIGAGGVARAIGPAITDYMTSNAVLDIYDRDTERAESLVKQIGGCARVIDVEHLPEAIEWANGLINATPLGMVEYPGSAFDKTLFKGHQAWAFDAVYTPPETAFLRDAKSAGIETLSGFELFKHMAIRSFAAYTGIAVDQDIVLPKLDVLRPE